MIIGLTGYSRSGKGTVADVLARERGFKRVAFADPLRDTLFALDPYLGPCEGFRLGDVVRHWEWEEAKGLAEVRRALQALGDGCRLAFGSDVLIERALAVIEGDPGSDWVVPDVRMPAEVAALRSLGATIWRVTRPGTGPVNGHRTETALDGAKYDALVENDAGAEALGHRVLELCDISRESRPSTRYEHQPTS